MRIGVISNERSHGNRRGGALFDHVPTDDGVTMARLRRSASGDRADLAEVLADFAARGVELIVVDGGDGTIRDILGRLDEAYPGDWPALALLPSGKTNAVAADLGHSGRGMAALDRLLAARKAGTLETGATERPALEVVRPGERALRGFLFGYAALTEGVRFANAKVHPAGVNKGLAVILSAGGVIRAGLAARGRDPSESGTAAALSVDGKPAREGRSFLMMASTLDRLTPGLRPFWDRGAGPIRWLDVPAPLRHPVKGLARMALGKPRPWMEREGYASGRAELLEIHLDAPFVLDGELFEPGGRLTIRATRPIRFLRA